MVTLKEGTTTCLQLFIATLSRLPQIPGKYGDEMPLEKLRDEYERFLVWSGNLGALQKGHSSLDWRLRDAETMAASIEKFLESLREHLENSLEIITQKRLPYEEQMQELDDDDSISTDSDGSNDEHSIVPELVTRMRAIATTVKHLYQISFNIRRPGGKSAPRRATRHRECVPDTAIEVGDAYAPFDREHVIGVLDDLRKRFVGEAARSSASEDDNALVDRLTGGITKRRRQFRYWASHQRRLAIGTDTINNRLNQVTFMPEEKKEPSERRPAEVRQQMPEVPATNSQGPRTETEATRYIPLPANQEDAISVAPSASTARDLDGQEAAFPEPPEDGRNGREFQCPYCFVLCPPKEAKRHHWRKHVSEDLQPYMCTYSQCKQPDALFSSRAEWVSHEDSHHRRAWRCRDHPDAVFSTSEGYVFHLSSLHSDLTADQVEAAEDLSVIVLEETRLRCPMCLVPVVELKKGQTLLKHMANHLERIACFAFPRDLEEAKENSMDAASNQSDDSRRISDMSSISNDRDGDSPVEDVSDQQLTEWLSAPDPSLIHHAVLPKTSPSTCEWLLGSPEFVSWQECTHSLLWLYGNAGSGKTVMSSVIIDHLLHHNKSDPAHLGILVYFYFIGSDTKVNFFDAMARSLIIQCAKQIKTARQQLIQLFTQHSRGGTQPTSKQLGLALRKIVQDHGEVTIILDAIDECADRSQLLSWIEDMAEFSDGKLRLLVTYRQQEDIERSFGKSKITEELVSISEPSLDENNGMRALVKARIANSSGGLAQWRSRPDVQHEIANVLTKNSHGMIQYIECQLDILERYHTLYELRNTLSSLPLSLYGTYEWILAKIPRKWQSQATRVLQFLVHSPERMRVDEVVDAIAVNVELTASSGFDPRERKLDPRDLLMTLSGLVRLTGVRAKNEEPQEYYLELVHSSVKSYLLSNQCEATFRAQLTKSIATTAMAKVCLIYLMSLADYHVPADQSASRFPLSAHSTRHWMWYSSSAEESDATLQTLILNFSTNSSTLAAWLRVFQAVMSSKITPMHHACVLNQAIIIEPLIKLGADVNARSEEFETALEAAVANRNKGIIRILLDAGADVNALGSDGNTALQTASLAGDEQIITLLLDAGADVNAQGRSGSAALCVASSKGKEKVVKLLLDAGANVNTARNDGCTALHIAASNGYERIVRLLLDAGADFNAPRNDGCTALQTAALFGHERVARLLLDAGADVNDPGNYGYTALYIAASNGYEQVVRLLLENGADVNAVDEYGRTTLLATIQGAGNERVLELLLEKGADSNTHARNNDVPLVEAAALGREQMVKMLLESGADINAQGENGRTALEVATRLGYASIGKMLLDAGADIET